MIKLSTLNSNQGRIVRECMAPFVTVEGGDEHVEQIRVKYVSRSIEESQTLRAEAKAKEENEDLYLSDLLLPMLDSLPDFVDDKDRPVKLTLDVLRKFNSINLRAILHAINTDVAGKVLPPPSKNGSKPAA